MDLQHPRWDGFSLGEEIRKQDPRGFIVYVTAFSDFANKTFQYHIEAMDYIVKESPEKIKAGVARCLDTALSRLRQGSETGQDAYYVLKRADRVQYIKIADSLYFETAARPHHIMLYTQSEIVDFWGSMQEVEHSLEGRFMRVHRSYLINPDKITGYDRRHHRVIFENGSRCLVSRSMKKALQAVILEKRQPLEK